MKEEKDQSKENSGRRNFLKMSLLAGGATVAGAGIIAAAGNKEPTGEKVKVLTTDGKTMHIDSGMLEDGHSHEMTHVSNKEAREGIPGKKFVMVVDLAKCRNALKCQDSCNKNHHISGQNAWLKVYKMQQNDDTAPFWMPMMCQHCDEPACVTVCPVDATFKRRDGIVLIDNQRCIGCRFCMAACPYSTRIFNWSEPNQASAEAELSQTTENSPERSGFPSIKGTVDKCDFCPHMIRQGELPHCVSACPNDVFLFGDLYEDAVTNGSSQSFKLSKLLEDKSGYKLMEALGTNPSVYFLPPVERTDAFEDGLKNYNEFESVSKPEIIEETEEL